MLTNQMFVLQGQNCRIYLFQKTILLPLYNVKYKLAICFHLRLKLFSVHLLSFAKPVAVDSLVRQRRIDLLLWYLSLATIRGALKRAHGVLKYSPQLTLSSVQKCSLQRIYSPACHVLSWVELLNQSVYWSMWWLNLFDQDGILHATICSVREWLNFASLFSKLVGPFVPWQVDNMTLCWAKMWAPLI